MPGEAAKLVGTVVNEKYRVLSELGTGSMGDVYEAEALATRSHVALKVLRVEDPTIAARFLREAKTMSLFQHENIVELLEVGELANGTLYFATELVRGITLRQLLDAGPIETRRTLAIIRQVLDALGHAHAMGVVHRDVKPENIMLAEGGSPGGNDLVKMLDFGVAKLVGDTPAVLGEGTLTTTGYATLGTPFYMSPEAVLGRVVDARADLYSVGVLTFEMLTGKPPYAHDDVTVLMRMHAAAPIPTLADRAPDRASTAELELLISEALAKKPELRFKSTVEMIVAVNAAIRSLEPLPEPSLAVSAASLGAAPLAPVPATEGGPPQSVKSTDVFGALPLKPPAAPAPPAHAATSPAAAPLFAPPMPHYPPAVAPAGAAPRAAGAAGFAQRHRKWLLAGIGVFALVIVIAIAALASGGGTGNAAASAPGRARPELGREAEELISAGHPGRAVELLESEDIGDDPALHLLLGHARIASGRRLDGLAAYERAIAGDRQLAADADVRTSVERVLQSRDGVAAVVALELAIRLTPPAHDLVQAQAASGKVGDVRRRAFAIAERERIAEGIDRVESWSLDLAQAGSCEERRAAIAKLRRTGDPRAVPALRKAKAHRCVEREVAEAITSLQARPSPQE